MKSIAENLSAILWVGQEEILKRLARPTRPMRSSKSQVERDGRPGPELSASKNGLSEGHLCPAQLKALLPQQQPGGPGHRLGQL